MQEDEPARIDLHCHVEGSIDPALSYEIQRAAGCAPAGTATQFIESVTSFGPSYVPFSAALHRLEACLLDRPSTIKAVADIVRRAARQGVKILELMFAPGEFKRGAKTNDLRPYTEAVLEGIATGRRGRDILAGARMTLVSRHLTGTFRTTYGGLVEHIEEYRGDIVGVDVCGLDRLTAALRAQWGTPAVEWDLVWLRSFCDRVRNSGLRLTAHAGEFLSAEAVGWALDLGAERIGHGIQCVADSEILERVVAAGAVLEVCPISNYRTGAVPPGAPHPLPALLARGVAATINTDDPGVQGSDWAGEYRVAREELQLNAAQLRACVRNAWRASFLPGAEKERYRAVFDAPEPDQEPDQEIVPREFSDGSPPWAFHIDK